MGIHSSKGHSVSNFRPMSVIAKRLDPTWHGGRSRPRPHCIRCPREGAQQPSPLFDPCLLWANGHPSQLLLSSCTNDGEKTVHPMLSDRCPVLSVTLVYCDQTVGLIKMPLGMEVHHGSGDIVLDEDPASHERGTAGLTFRPTLLWHCRPSRQLLSSC